MQNKDWLPDSLLEYLMVGITVRYRARDLIEFCSGEDLQVSHMTLQLLHFGLHSRRVRDDLVYCALKQRYVS